MDDHRKVDRLNVRLEKKNIQCLASFAKLLDDEIEEGDGVANHELLVDVADHRVVVHVVVPPVQVRLQVVAQTLLVQRLVHEFRRVLDVHVDKVQQVNGQEFCTQREKHLIIRDTPGY